MGNIVRNSNIKQTIIDGFDFTVDEGPNTFIALRKVKWSDTGTPRLDLRKYLIDANGEEVIQKGVGFITEEGPHELAKVLVEQGFGHTSDIIDGIKNRDDFMTSLVKCLNSEVPEELADAIDEDTIKSIDEEEEEMYDIAEVI